jgi:hypothetical protein
MYCCCYFLTVLVSFRAAQILIIQFRSAIFLEQTGFAQVLFVCLCVIHLYFCVDMILVFRVLPIVL